MFLHFPLAFPTLPPIGRGASLAAQHDAHEPVLIAFRTVSQLGLRLPPFAMDWSAQEYPAGQKIRHALPNIRGPRIGRSMTASRPPVHHPYLL